MTCQLHFLDVGNADCCVVLPDSQRAVVVDIGMVEKLMDCLEKLAVAEIGALYITHEHQDHMPPIVQFEEFLTKWKFDGKTVDCIFLPRGSISRWTKKRKSLESEAAEGGPDARKKANHAKRIKGAIQRLYDYSIYPAEKGPSPYIDRGLSIELLHPSFMSLEGDMEPKSNEASVVLRVCYGQFATMLLGDLEGKGLAECLMLREDQLRAHVVKIPHHGAWPVQFAAELEALLKRIRPAIAILSVGSTNSHKHVAPELFELLLQLQSTMGLQFICTQATRTCVHTPEERQRRHRSGLAEPMPCAGDVAILAELDGSWTKRTETDHLAMIKKVPLAACDGRADLRIARSILQKCASATIIHFT